MGEGIFGPNDVSLEDLRVCGSVLGEMQVFLQTLKSKRFAVRLYGKNVYMLGLNCYFV